MNLVALFLAIGLLALWDSVGRKTKALKEETAELKRILTRQSSEVDLQARRIDVSVQRVKGTENAIGELNKKLNCLKDFRQLQKKKGKFK